MIFYLYLSLGRFTNRIQELINRRDKYDNNREDLTEAGLVVEIYQTESYSYYFPGSYHKGHNVLLELFYHSVHKYLSHKGC
jgi:hypothetical protein